MRRRGEFALIAEVFAPLATAAGALGLQDDAALVDVPPESQLVITTDTVIADVHFRRGDPADLVARKALRVNLSDLAAKGARPLGALQAITLGDATDDAYLDAYGRGLAADLAEFEVPLLGGDTTSHRTGEVIGRGGPLTITITALGVVPRGKALLRSGARPGDLLCVSGTIGDAAVGLRHLLGALPPISSAHARLLTGRYHLPEPRLALGQALRDIATAACDISDGLCADVAHLCTASGVGAEILWSAVPRSRAVDRCLMDDPSLSAAVLGSGDDYELAFTIPSQARAALGEIAGRLGTPVSVIGRIVESAGGGENSVTVRDELGRPMAVPRAGFTHT